MEDAYGLELFAWYVDLPPVSVSCVFAYTSALVLMIST